MTDSNAAPTATPWELIPQDGAGHLIAHREADGTLRLIAHMLERKHSLAEDLANGERIVTACNTWSDPAALRARLAELEGGR